MFHVFALAYHSTVFLWPTLLFFHCFATASVYCNTSMYTVPLRMRGASTFAIKFLQINIYVKWSRTWNMFLFLVRWQEFFLLIFYGLPYYFSTVLWTMSARVSCDTSASVYHNASLYTVPLRMQGASMFTFKFFKIIYRYAKWSGTWNMSLFLAVWQKFKSPSYECFYWLWLFGEDWGSENLAGNVSSDDKQISIIFRGCSLSRRFVKKFHFFKKFLWFTWNK